MAKHHLLTLASEVRLNILKQYFDGIVGRGMSISRFDLATSTNNQPTRLRKVVFFRRGVTEPVDLDLLRVCRILRMESLSVMATNVALEVDWMGEVMTRSSWFHKIAQHCSCYVMESEDIDDEGSWQERTPDLRKVTVHMTTCISMSDILRKEAWTVEDTDRLQEEDVWQRLYTRAHATYLEVSRYVREIAHLEVQMFLGSFHVGFFSGNTLHGRAFVSPMSASTRVR